MIHTANKRTVRSCYLRVLILALCIAVITVTYVERSPLYQTALFYSSTTENARFIQRYHLNSSKCFRQVYMWLETNDGNSFISRGRSGDFSCSTTTFSCDIRVAFGTNVKELEAGDIIFLYYKSYWNWDTLMRHRRSHQKWVFWTSESPRHTNRRVIPPPQYADIYDYAMTYRRGVRDQGAVLLGSYGEYHQSVPSAGANKLKNLAENKTKAVAWVASNCFPHILSWKRTEFVVALSRLVDVDFYGPCGNQKCDNIETCGLQKYKFYLAFENSECRDYITEKFWRNSLALGLVPIVFGPPKEDYLKVAPPNSFIFVQDFENLADLADYLKILDRNDTLYNQYFEWRKHGSVSYYLQFSNFDPEFLCSNVVKTIVEDEAEEAATGRSRAKPVLPDLTEWWANSCRADQDFPI